MSGVAIQPVKLLLVSCGLEEPFGEKFLHSKVSILRTYFNHFQMVFIQQVCTHMAPSCEYSALCTSSTSIFILIDVYVLKLSGILL